MASEYCRLRKSRDNWNKKAVERATQIREMRKQVKRYRERINALRTAYEERIWELEGENASLKASNKAMMSRNGIPLDSFIMMQTLCVMLITVGIVSFRSIPRILTVFKQYGFIQVSRIPHFTSVINWTLRSGVALMESVKRVSFPWLAMIDCSIDIGTRKALIVLRVSLSVLQEKGNAIELKDCECIGIEIANNWNGESVKSVLEKIFEKAGYPKAIIKDNGTDLCKGVRLTKEDVKQLEIVEDIGHVTANALKAEFAEEKAFEQFLEITRKGSSRIRQTAVAYICPPKIRTKGRFQGITTVAKWAEKMINIIGKRGRAKSGSDVSILRNAFSGLSGLRQFLKRFCSSCQIIERFLKLLKQKGINPTTHGEAKMILEKLPMEMKARQRLLEWLDRHLHVQSRLGMEQMPLCVSSDIIESLFGKFKEIIQRNENAELNRLVYVIPLLCGTHTTNDIQMALRNCSHQELLNHIEKEIPITLRQLRRKKLNGQGKVVPKTGNMQMCRTG